MDFNLSPVDHWHQIAAKVEKNIVRRTAIATFGAFSFQPCKVTRDDNYEPHEHDSAVWMHRHVVTIVLYLLLFHGLI